MPCQLVLCLGDLTFGDSSGAYPMSRLTADGSQLDSYPLGPSAIRNPEYVATAPCGTVGGGTSPNCYDPVHSYWAIDTAASDPFGRALTYSMSVVANDALAEIVAMRQELRINSITGLITQTCASYVNVVRNTTCYDGTGGGIFTITVFAQPTGGAIPLVRTFKIAVWNQG